MADVPGSTTTSHRLAVGGSATNTVEVNLDQDWYQVWLAEGVSYQIGLNGSGTSPLGDPLVRLLDVNGTEIAQDNDGGGGLNSLLTYTPSVTGRYFVSAQANPVGGHTGEYTLTLNDTDIAPDTSTTARLVPDGPDVPGTLVNTVVFEPLTGTFVIREHDEDWYRVDVQAGQHYRFLFSETGPDGAQGIDLTLYNAAGNLVFRLTNPGDWDWGYIDWIPGSSGTWFLGVGGADTSGGYTLAVNRITDAADSPLESIDASTVVHTPTIEVYFAQAGETFGEVTSEGWNDYEIGQAMAALQTYSNIANLTFTQTTVLADAEFTLVLDDNELSLTDIAGQFGLPGSIFPGIGSFDGNWAGWSSTSGGATDQGGFGWETLLHEFGHGLGLAHPHDDIFASTIMNGVDNSDDLGDFDLNQGVYTVMSYNSGWVAAPHGQPTRPNGRLDPTYGWDGTPSAFDIALIQQSYGANMSYHTGDDTYTLPVANQSGTFYSSIWDAGGTDTISAGAASVGATIDLRPATLRYEPGGGGFISYHDGVHGGFTIANGVVIENAIGGDGNDRITGNDAANVLDGGGADDAIDGGAGDDSVDGGQGNDTVNGGDGTDTAMFAGNWSDYRIDLLANGEVQIVDQRSGSPDATDTLNDVETIAFADRTIAPVAQLGDVLWRHGEGTVATADHSFGVVSTTWQTSGIGDFDGDGDGDLLWRNRDGDVVTWEMENGQLFSTHGIGFASAGWEIVNVGDFDSDGDSDVLWRHRDGEVVTWEMQNGGYVVNHDVEFASIGWTVQGAGDFDADGDADVLWRHRDGAVVIWEMENGGYVVNHNIAFIPTNWTIQGTGDFDADGDDDILWRDQDGEVLTWEMQNGDHVANHDIAFASIGWRVAGILDFNSDGTDDILWRHQDGTVVTWEMRNGEFLQAHNFGPVGNDWQIRSTGGFDLV